MSTEDTASLRQNLVRAIGEYAGELDPIILNAFQTIPRDQFVGDFLTRNKDTGEWERVAKDSPNWLSQVYTNIQLVTGINQYNKPSVSSSMPGIMARMLQSLQLRPEQRVLEIGTGTGYNAAILASIVGPGNVVTLDINQSLLTDARKCIEQTVGAGVTVLCIDGRNIPESLGTFDAIIVSASSQSIEPSWISALNQHGRLVVNWNTSFSKVFFELEKQGRGLSGAIAQYSGDFMKLHAGDGVAPKHIDWDKHAPILEEIDFRNELVMNFDFGFFLQIHIPSLCYWGFTGNTSGRRFYAVAEARARTVYFSPEKVRGDASLWQDILELHGKFNALGKPRRKAFTLQVDEDGGMTFFYQGHTITAIQSYVLMDR